MKAISKLCRTFATALAAGALGSFVALTVLPAVAAETASLDATDRADLARIEKYLNELTTVDSHFVQLSQDGFVEGRLRLSRPGNMRIEYEPPVPVLIVASDLIVMYYDHELHQTTFIPTFETPAHFLLREKIDLSDGLTVIGFEREASVLRVTLVETDNPDTGRITIVFEDKPLRLVKWRVVDAQASVVDVSLVNPRFGVEFANADELFSTVDPAFAKGADPGVN